MKIAISLPLYDRVDCLRRTIPALLQCRELKDYPLCVGCDGPTSESRNYKGNIEAARSYAQQSLHAKYPAQIDFTYRKENFGLSRNILETTQRAFKLFEADAVIALEDDVEVSRDFLTFVRRCVERYADNHYVMAVLGNCEICRADTVHWSANPARLRAMPWWETIAWAITREKWNTVYPQYYEWKANPLGWTQACHRRIGEIYGSVVAAACHRMLFLHQKKFYDATWGGVFNICRAIKQWVVISPYAARARHIGWYGTNMRQAEAAEKGSTPETPWRASPCFRDDWGTEKLDLIFPSDEVIKEKALFQGYA